MFIDSNLQGQSILRKSIPWFNFLTFSVFFKTDIFFLFCEICVNA